MNNKNTLVFEEDAKPETHIFVGTWRPPFCPKDLLKNMPSHIWIDLEVVRSCWANGDFDKPLYKKIVEDE